MAYDARTQDDLSKWWITGTGSSVNRLSEVMDDMPDGPAIYHMDADNAWTAGAGSEWYVATTTKPDDVADNLSGWSKLTATADDNMGSLNADEWTFDTGNNRVYVRLSDSSDPNATDMRKHYAWDGSGAAAVIMTETRENQDYTVSLEFEIGDGSTATTLTSLAEHVYFNGCAFVIKDSATLSLGEKVGDWGRSGSLWVVSPTGSGTHTVTATSSTAVFNMYASHLRNIATDKNLAFENDTIEILNSQLSSVYAANENDNNFFDFKAGIDTLTIKDAFFSDVSKCMISSSGTLENIHVHSCKYGLSTKATAPVQLVVDKLLVTSNSDEQIIIENIAETDATVRDAQFSVATKAILNQPDSTLYEKFKVNVNVVDKDGTAVQGAVVDCEDKDANAVWTAGTISTDASGDIAEQTVTYKRWRGTSETETVYSPHKFTISKAGYKTLVLDAVTVGDTINWRHELQFQEQPVAAWQEGMM